MSLTNIYRELVRQYKGSTKQQFDREHVFFLLYRPISFPFTAVCLKLGLTANVVTAIGAAVLLCAMAAFFMGHLLMGACLYLAAYLLDFVDGNIARYKGGGSEFGKMVDGLVDSLTFLLFVSLAQGNVIRGGNWLSGNLEVALGVVVSFGFLFRVYFSIRNAFVSAKMALEKPADLQANNATPEAKRRHPLLKAIKFIYFGLISGMPIFVLMAVLFEAITLFLLVSFGLFVVLTALEVGYGLWRMYQREYGL